MRETTVRRFPSYGENDGMQGDIIRELKAQLVKKEEVIRACDDKIVMLEKLLEVIHEEMRKKDELLAEKAAKKPLFKWKGFK